MFLNLGLPTQVFDWDWIALLVTIGLEAALALLAITKAFVVGDALEAIVDLKFGQFWHLFWIGTGTYALAAALNALS